MPQQADEIFEDPFFASLYDYFNAWDDCDEFYLGLAREIGGPVLDLGCGTGMLACRIAQEGLEVVGADPAEGSPITQRSGSRVLDKGEWTDVSFAAELQSHLHDRSCIPGASQR